MTKKYKSDVSAALHEMATDLHKAGHLDTITMKTFDETCFIPKQPMTPARIKRIRKKLKVSQSVLATILQVRTGTVSKWEQGSAPDGPAHQLLDIIDRKGLDIFAR